MACLASGLLAPVSRADTILVNDSNTLTTMKLTAATAGQGVRPIVDQRGVNIDGSMRMGGGYAWMLAGNPFESGAGGARLGDINLATGAYSPTDVDIALPAPGMSRVVIGRSFNGVQLNGAAHFDSAGYQGTNWFQISQPEIAFYDDATNTRDVMYVVYGADRFLEFNRTGSGATDPFQARNGAAGVIKVVAGSPDTYIWYDQRGTATYFFGGNTASGAADWQFWKIVDAAGNVAYVGDSTTASTAVTNGYSGKKITKLYDGAANGGRRFSYTYNGSNQLTSVVAETKTGGTWSAPTGVAEVGRVEYTYYGAAESHGSNGNLKVVTITTPLTDSGVSLTRKKYYRYWKGPYDGTTEFGSANTLKMVVGFEGCRKYDWDQDSILDDDFLTASDASLKAYADYYFENGSGTDYKIKKSFANGECGCSGGNNGEYLFTYATNGSYSDTSGYTTTWQRRTVVDPPTGGTWVTQFFDECCQPISRVLTDIDPASATSKWPTQVVREINGRVNEIHTPANITAYTHATGAFTASTTVGLVWFHERVSTGDATGFLQGIRQREGSTSLSTTSNYVSYTTYTTRDFNISGTVDVTRPMVSARRAYHTAGTVATSNHDETTMAYTWWSATTTDPLYITLKQSTTTNPIVTTANNGSNSATASKSYHRKDGTVAFTETPLGRVDYMQYTNGQLTKRIDDATTNSATDFAGGDDPNTDFGMTENGNGWARTSTMAYDAQGRSDTTTAPDGLIRKAYYSRLKDHRPASISFPRMTTSGTTTYFGPAGYSVSNQAGRGEFSGTIAIANAGLTDVLTLWIDELDADPITALDKGTLARMSTSILNKPGTRVEEARAYFVLPASGVGVEGTNYDATRYGFDDVGRQWRVKDATGTIQRTAFDTAGRTYRRYIGTNDSTFTGGEPSGTDTMVKTEELVYDTGSAGGNSLLTQRTAYVEDTTTDQRITNYTYDYRGRLIVTVGPQAPYTVSKFDNLGRSVGVGQYSSSSGLVSTSDPTALATNRVALSQSFFDQMGRVYRTQRHKITQSTGADADNLKTDTWRDADGRVTKTDGSQLTKTLFDRLGRATHQFVLAKDNDTVYADADDVTGDVVLEESQTTYESASSDNVMMRASISRFHDDLALGNTGALDTNADAAEFKYTAANVKGRIQISAMWYDDLDRVTDSVSYGTNGGSDFDRKPSGSWLTLPSRSDTALVTTTTYDTDGTVLEVTDPKALKMRYAYDKLGRKTAEIRNYIDGTPTSPVETATDDVTTRFEYTKGLQTKVWVDFDADGVVDTTAPKDQVTTYIFGTTKATPTAMKIATGHLLRAIKYPDSTNTGTTTANIDTDSSDVVSFAYNALGQTAYQKDQGGNIIETVFDTAGRETHRRVTTLGSGFDNAVLRISKTYLSRGLLSKLTQYNNATVGSGSVVDDVKYAYDDWGNITSFKTDPDSDLDLAASGVPAQEVTYSWAKNETGRNTLRKTQAVYASASLTYTYTSTGNVLDNDVSRVSQVTLTSGSTITLANYTYNGLGHLVGTDLLEPDIRNFYYEGAASGSYPDLDSFNRVTSSRWTKYGISPVRDFVDLDLAYDRGSNITSVQDNVADNNAGVRRFDALYGLDNLNRVNQVQEGNLSAGSITNKTREEQWKTSGGANALTQTGNWNNYRLDLDGNGTFNGTSELDETRTFNEANELATRVPTSGGSTETLTYDGNGNQTDDGANYQYVYDAFGRLRQVKNRTTPFALVAEYRYNALGFRIGWRYDSVTPAGIDASDPWYYFQHNEQWQIVATFRGSDASPKERFVWHLAGIDGQGGSSYIDSMIVRELDANGSGGGGWTAASDGTLEKRYYYAQNWRADVSAMVDDTGKLIERVKYSAYGTPFGLPAGDSNSDGAWDATDSGNVSGTPPYTIQCDADLSGTITAADATHANSIRGGFQTLGRGKLSSVAIYSRVGYAGYQYEPTFQASRQIHHVRHRVLDSGFGRWLRRDPIGYHDGMGLYEYVKSKPVAESDASGLVINSCPGSGGSTVPDYLPSLGAAPLSGTCIPPVVPMPVIIVPGLNVPPAVLKDIIPCGWIDIAQYSSCNIKLTFEPTVPFGCVGAKMGAPGNVCNELYKMLPAGGSYGFSCNPGCFCDGEYYAGIYTFTGKVVIETPGCKITATYKITVVITGYIGMCLCSNPNGNEN